MRGDIMKFAEIEYGDIKDSRFNNWFNSVFRPYSTENISVLGAQGYRILINLPKNAEDTLEKRVFDKIKVFLKQNDVVSQTGINMYCVHYADGNIIGVLNLAQKLRPEFEAVIIEGEKYLTETALSVVSPRVRYVSLLCRDKNAYEKAWEYYFNEYGINIQFINSFKHENYLNADAVIDCKNLSRKFSALASKENALYVIDEKIRFLSDKNIDIIKRAELIENMKLSALTSN